MKITKLTYCKVCPVKKEYIKVTILTILPYENLKGQQEAYLECEKINSKREVNIYNSLSVPEM